MSWICKFCLTAGAAARLLAAAPDLRAQEAPTCPGLPPGRHALLERMTAQFGLTCEQELKVEPLLHDEESVTKPLLKFSSFPREQQNEVMTTIRLAARRQVRQFLTPAQQKDMDSEVESASKGGKKKGEAAAAPPAPGLASEEELSAAIVKYAALKSEERTALLLKVETAARNDAALQLTAEQQAKLDAEIRALRK